MFPSAPMSLVRLKSHAPVVINGHYPRVSSDGLITICQYPANVDTASQQQHGIYMYMLKVLPGLSQDGVPGSQEFVDMGLVTEC